MKITHGILLLIFAVSFLLTLAHGINRQVKRGTTTIQLPTGEDRGRIIAPVDTRPAEVIALEQETGYPIKFEQGREAYSKYGYEFALYSRDSFGFVWENTLQEAIESARYSLLLRAKERELEPIKDAQRAKERERRAAEWDAKHATETKEAK